METGAPCRPGGRGRERERGRNEGGKDIGDILLEIVP